MQTTQLGLPKAEPIDYIFRLLPPKLKGVIASRFGNDYSDVCEIRLRLGKQLSVTGKSGGQLEFDCACVSQSDIETVITRAFRNSVYSYKRELISGYITYDGGCRVGFCGTAVLNPADGYKIENIKNISSVNIRIAREIKGCGDEIYKSVYSDGLKGLLIAGAPSSGKTTILRDLTRQLGDVYRVSLIDERGEIAASCGGAAQNDVGKFTDVFDSYSRYDAILTAVRVMSPMIIVCDEIGTQEDYTALEYAINSGVKILASCHCENYYELIDKPVISKLIEAKVFDKCAVVKDCGHNVNIIDLGDKKCLEPQVV